MRTTKEQRDEIQRKFAGTIGANAIADLDDAVEWLIDITSVQCPVCGGEDGDHAEACELGAFLREPQGEVEREL